MKYDYKDYILSVDLHERINLRGEYKEKYEILKDNKTHIFSVAKNLYDLILWECTSRNLPF